MRLFSRASPNQGSGSSTLQGLVGSLSLVLANYKPTPILPTNSSSLSNVPLPPSSNVQAGGSSFQVANGGGGNSTHKQLHLPHQDLNASEWGTPSSLYVPNDWAGSSTAGGNHLSKSVGPGGCTVLGSYTPEESLPKANDFAPFDAATASVMRYRKQISVNLGSWFVLENWMAPSMFSCANHAASAEHDVLSGYGVSEQGLKSAKARLEQHWDTWVRKRDFAEMASLGINTVRIPIGYWLTGETKWTDKTPFQAWVSVYENEMRYLTRAINWAAEYDLGVLIDLHGAYGSQNGQAHSGLSNGKIEFFQQGNEDRTTDLLVMLTEIYANVTNVVGIEILNEPNGWYRSQTYDWYPKAMDRIRKANNPQAKTFPLFFHDAFDLNMGAEFIKGRSDFVVQDNHMYYVHSAADQRTSASSHTSHIEGTVHKNLVASSRMARNNLIVGEWSCALAESSLQGARNAHNSQQTFCDAQSQIYQESTGGWSFWSWKLESCNQNAGWCFQATEKTGLMTSPLRHWTNTVSSGSGSGSKPSSSSSGNGRSMVQTSSGLKNTTQILSQIADGINNMNGPSLPYSATSSPTSKRGGGSPAVRAAWEIRAKQLTVVKKAGNTGYSDGYMSAKIFASQRDSKKPVFLSRMGFTGQYIADSFEAHVAAGTLQKDDWDAYQSHFGQGLSAAEDKITSIVKQHSS